MSFQTFCDHAAHGRLTLVKQMLESIELHLNGNGNLNDALVRAADNGHVDVVDYLVAAREGHLAVIDRLLQDPRVDPSARDNYAVRLAAHFGHLAIVERLLQDDRVDPSAKDNYAVRWAAQNGQLCVCHSRSLSPVRACSAPLGNEPDERQQQMVVRRRR
jgi:ankyrin repeat protein